MAKEAGLPADEPNRKTKADLLHASRVNKTSKNDGSIDVFGPLDPTGLGNKRASKGFAGSTPPAKGKRDDSFLGRFDSTRKADLGPRNWVRRDEGQDQVERIGDNFETFAQTDVPDEL
jgi:hypothetical protein